MKILLILALTIATQALYAENKCFMVIYLEGGKQLLLRNKNNTGSLTTEFILPTSSGAVKFGEIMRDVFGKTNQLESATMYPGGRAKTDVDPVISYLTAQFRGYNYERGMARNDLKFLMTGTLSTDPNNPEIGWLIGKTASIICKKL